MNKFRPQEISKTFVMKQRLKTGRTDNYNWQCWPEWYPAHWNKSQQQFAKRFARLHYLACHAPLPIQRKWKSAYRSLMTNYFGDAGCASMRYLNNWSAHSWL